MCRSIVTKEKRNNVSDKARRMKRGKNPPFELKRKKKNTIIKAEERHL